MSVVNYENISVYLVDTLILSNVVQIIKLYFLDNKIDFLNELKSILCFQVCTDLTKMKHRSELGSGCDSVGRAVASDTRGPQLESSHQ